MTKGFRRPTKKHSDAYQLDRLADAGVPEENTEVEWANVPHKAVRPGDTLAVVALHLLAPDEPTFLERCHDLAGCGADILDLSTGQRYDPASLAAFPAVKESWQAEKGAFNDRGKAKAAGAKGGRPVWAKATSAPYKAAVAYLRQDKTPAEVKAIIWQDHKIEVSEATLKRMKATLKTKAK